MVALRGMLVLAALCVACGSDSDDEPGAPAPAPPDAPGPYAVGVTTLETTSEGRSLPIEVWYPAQASTQEAVVYPVMLGALKLADLPSSLGAVRDAVLDGRGAPYPVVLFSHGNGGMRTQSVYLTEYLASHGFVVAAPDHVGNTIAEQVNQSGLAPAVAARLRPLDMSRTLDALLEVSALGGELLRGAADPARVGASGHSFGGFTTFRLAGATIDADAAADFCATADSLVCEGWEELGEFPESARDERVTAALPQAPGGAQIFAVGNGGYSSVAVPTMVQGGTTDEVTPFEPESRQPYSELIAPAYLLGIENAGHFTFSDVCQLLDIAGISLEELSDGCVAGDIEWPLAHSLINRYATAFFQLHLRDDPPTGALAADAEHAAEIAVWETK